LKTTSQKPKNRKASSHIPLSLFLILFSVFVCLAFASNTSDRQSVQNLDQNYEAFEKRHFIQVIAPLAKSEQEKYGILSSLTLAQACLESDFGRSLLSAKYDNLFGVKAYGDAPQVSLETKEYEDGKWITINDNFRVYQSWQESVDAHSLLFVNGVNWDPNKYQSVLSAENYIEAAQAVQNSGYATDLNYSDKLIKLIEEYKLYDYDK
jgi:mannosyl-glycoprotein endo-beta-N-acetylglucosaminidase